MQLGFVNFNTDEKKRVAKMMQLLQESEAIEELGIGRVRDHFSNTLFPGTSTLQHHAKYFAVMPSLYYHAAYKSKRFQSFAEVNRYIKEAEVQITRQLAENESGELKVDITGITGVSTYKEALYDCRKYVKYDPAYIYGSGLVKYGIIPSTSITRLVFELNKKHYSDPHHKDLVKNEDETNDADELSGDKQVIKTSGETYDFFGGKTMDIRLTAKEASFLKDRIDDTCKGTMLAFLVNCSDNLPDRINYFDLCQHLNGLNQDVLDVYMKSVLFSKLIHLIDWRFNHAYYDSFGKTDEAEKCDLEYNKLLAEYKNTLDDKDSYSSLFEYIRSVDVLLTEFCENCYKTILINDTELINRLVIEREHTVKRERSKIGNSAYASQTRVVPSPNTFRWESVRTMVSEIRNPR